MTNMVIAVVTVVMIVALITPVVVDVEVEMESACGKPGHSTRECPSEEGRGGSYAGSNDRYGGGGGGHYGPDRNGGRPGGCDRDSGTQGESLNDCYNQDRFWSLWMSSYRKLLFRVERILLIESKRKERKLKQDTKRTTIKQYNDLNHQYTKHTGRRPGVCIQSIELDGEALVEGEVH